MSEKEMSEVIGICESCEESMDEYWNPKTYEEHKIIYKGEKLGLLCETCVDEISESLSPDIYETDTKAEHEYIPTTSDIAGYDEHMAESTEFLPNYDGHISEAKLEEADKQMLIDDVMVIINSHKDNVYCTREELARKISVICQWDSD